MEECRRTHNLTEQQVYKISFDADIKDEYSCLYGCFYVKMNLVKLLEKFHFERFQTMKIILDNGKWQIEQNCGRC